VTLKMVRALIALGALASSACGAGDSGGALFTFSAYASGIAGVGANVEFDTGAGFHVALSEARLHIGAAYLRLGQVNPGSANAGCVGETTYGLEVPGPVDVDVLSSDPQMFSVPGAATAELDLSGELWLVDGDLNRVASTTAVASVAGLVTKGGAREPFAGSITIGQNRLIPPANPAAPGGNPICKQRIIAPIPASVRPSPGGHLLLQIDPRRWFGDVDFAALLPGSDGATLVIPDADADAAPDSAAGRAFFRGLTGASADTSRFSWVAP
jgi:hypothetical protein